jgi:hypothetical protein
MIAMRGVVTQGVMDMGVLNIDFNRFIIVKVLSQIIFCSIICSIRLTMYLTL